MINYCNNYKLSSLTHNIKTTYYLLCLYCCHRHRCLWEPHYKLPTNKHSQYLVFFEITTWQVQDRRRNKLHVLPATSGSFPVQGLQRSGCVGPPSLEYCCCLCFFACLQTMPKPEPLSLTTRKTKKDEKKNKHFLYIELKSFLTLKTD